LVTQSAAESVEFVKGFKINKDHQSGFRLGCRRLVTTRRFECDYEKFGEKVGLRMSDPAHAERYLKMGQWRPVDATGIPVGVRAICERSK